jgi:hypothetical protein
MATQVVRSNSAAGLTAAVTAAIGAGAFPVGGVFVDPLAADGKRLCQIVNDVDTGITDYLCVGSANADTLAAAIDAALTDDSGWLPWGDPAVNVDDASGNKFVIAFQQGFGEGA